MLSRLLGLVREQLFAALVGASAFADAFVVAFRIPNLLRDLFAEGALSAAFVPTFTDHLTNRPREEAWRLANRVMNTLAVLLGVLTVAGMLLSEELVTLLASGFSDETAQLAARLTRIMLPFLPAVSLAAVAMGMLTSQGRFGAPALAPTAFNIVSILTGAGLWAAGLPPATAVTGWAVGTLLGGIAQLLIQLPSLRATGWRPGLALDLRLRDPGVRRIAKLMLPATVGLAATQVNIVVNTQFASVVPGAPAWLAYAFRLMQLPIGVFGVAVATVATASVARRAAERDMRGVDSTIGEGLRLVAFLTVPATAALAVLGEPIIRLIYQHGRFTAQDTRYTALALVAYSVGLYAYAAVKVVVPAFYALDDSRAPVRASVTAVVANVALNAVMFPLVSTKLGPATAGAALGLGTSAAALTNFALLLQAYRKRGGNLAGERLWRHLGVVGAASALAAAGGWACERALDGQFGHSSVWARVLVTLTALGTAAVVYLGVCRLLRVEELAAMLRAVRRRAGRGAN